MDKLKNVDKIENYGQIEKSGQNWKIWTKLKNLDKIEKYGQNNFFGHVLKYGNFAYCVMSHVHMLSVCLSSR